MEKVLTEIIVSIAKAIIENSTNILVFIGLIILLVLTVIAIKTITNNKTNYNHKDIKYSCKEHIELMQKQEILELKNYINEELKEVKKELLEVLNNVKILVKEQQPKLLNILENLIKRIEKLESLWR